MENNAVGLAKENFKLLKKLLKPLSKFKNNSGSMTSTNGAQANSGIVLGNMNLGVTPEELTEWFGKLKETITFESEDMRKSIEKTIDNTLVSKVAKIIAEAYKEHCATKSPNEEYKFELRDIKDRAQNITSDIQAIIDEQKDAKNAAKKIEKELKDMRETLNRQVTNLCALCEDILYWSRETHKLCGEIFEGMSLSTTKITEMFAKCMKEAESRHDALMSALSRFGVDEDTVAHSHARLDSDIIEKVFGAIESIRDDVESKGANVNEAFEKQYDILTETLAVGMDTNKRVVQLQEQLDKLYDVLYRKQCRDDKVADCVIQIKNTEDQIESQKLQAELDRMMDEFARERENGNKLAMKCPYCGYHAERIVIGGDCKCDICGHRFTVDPNMRGIDDEKVRADIERAQNWKPLHTAVLEQVSEDIGDNLYRMKLDIYTVSSGGVLIIPTETYDHKAISKVAFCRPNTDDKFGEEMLSKVKTLFLPENVTPVKFQDNYPFAEISGLERVIRYGADGQSFDAPDIYRKIKGVKEVSYA